MLPSDERSEWPAKLLTDERVTHFWDEKRVLGNWYRTFKEVSKGPDDVVWDAFFVYRTESVWTDQPSGLLGWGRPIITHKKQFLESVASSVKR